MESDDTSTQDDRTSAALARVDRKHHPRLVLCHDAAQDLPKIIYLEKDKVVFGRLKNEVVDIGLDSMEQRSSISKVHAEIVRTEEILFISDLESTNGVMVDGIKINKGHPLLHNNLIFFGNSKSLYRYRVDLLKYDRSADLPEREDSRGRKNFIKLCILMVEYAPKPLRSLLKLRWQSKYGMQWNENSGKELLSREMALVRNGKACNPLFEEQRIKIEVGRIADWDVSLLSTILLKSSQEFLVRMPPSDFKCAICSDSDHMIPNKPDCSKACKDVKCWDPNHWTAENKEQEISKLVSLLRYKRNSCWGHLGQPSVDEGILALYMEDISKLVEHMTDGVNDIDVDLQKMMICDEDKVAADLYVQASQELALMLRSLEDPMQSMPSTQMVQVAAAICCLNDFQSSPSSRGTSRAVCNTLMQSLEDTHSTTTISDRIDIIESSRLNSSVQSVLCEVFRDFLHQTARAFSNNTESLSPRTITEFQTLSRLSNPESELGALYFEGSHNEKTANVAELIRSVCMSQEFSPVILVLYLFMKGGSFADECSRLSWANAWKSIKSCGRIKEKELSLSNLLEDLVKSKKYVHERIDLSLPYSSVFCSVFAVHKTVEELLWESAEHLEVWRTYVWLPWQETYIDDSTPSESEPGKRVFFDKANAILSTVLLHGIKIIDLVQVNSHVCFFTIHRLSARVLSEFLRMGPSHLLNLRQLGLRKIAFSLDCAEIFEMSNCVVACGGADVEFDAHETGLVRVHSGVSSIHFSLRLISCLLPYVMHAFQDAGSSHERHKDIQVVIGSEGTNCDTSRSEALTGRISRDNLLPSSQAMEAECTKDDQMASGCSPAKRFKISNEPMHVSARRAWHEKLSDIASSGCQNQSHNEIILDCGFDLSDLRALAERCVQAEPEAFSSLSSRVVLGMQRPTKKALVQALAACVPPGDEDCGRILIWLAKSFPKMLKPALINATNKLRLGKKANLVKSDTVEAMAGKLIAAIQNKSE